MEDRRCSLSFTDEETEAQRDHLLLMKSSSFIFAKCFAGCRKLACKYNNYILITRVQGK